MELSEQTKRELSRLITVSEAATKLKKSESSVRQYIIKKILPAFKLGVVIDPADLPEIESKLKKRGRKKKV